MRSRKVSIMSSDESGAGCETTPEGTEAEEQNVVSRVAGLPLVSSTYDMVFTAYASTKENHPLLKSVCDVAEKGVRTVTAAAVSGAQPLLNKLEPQIAMANEYACRGLDKLEENLPVLQQPSEKVVADTKELVSAGVTGARDVVSLTVNGAKGAVTSGVSGVVGLAKGAVQGGVNTVLGSRVGQLVATGMEAMLGKSEELVDHYLPMTDQELAQLATSVEGFEGATVEQQKEQRSYFVRLGSLSAKLRHRAFQHSLAKLKDAKRGTEETLAKLHQTLELMEHVKGGMGEKLQASQEKLHQMYLEWNRTQTGSEEEVKSLVQPEVESRTLAMLRSLTQQLHLSSATLLSRVQGLPAGVQEKAQSVRHTVEDLRTSFAAAHSFHDVPATLLAQSRERLAQARGSVDEMVDYVARNVPLPWVVGPFAPNLVELLEVPHGCHEDGDKEARESLESQENSEGKPGSPEFESSQLQVDP
uniref:Perilipin n=2 Tax=Pogona vitticeps TaxID=103695 RepID=A0ABM5EM46_9SAUR